MEDPETRVRRGSISGVSGGSRDTWEEREHKWAGSIEAKIGIQLQDADVKRAHRIGKV